MIEHDEFYIGWDRKAPSSYGRATRRGVTAVLALAVLAGLGLATSQRLIGVAFFEWGNVKEFTGVLHAKPYPYLAFLSDGTNTPGEFDTAPLVAPLKFGVKHEEVASLEGQLVKLHGTRIHRDGRLMIELRPGSIVALPSAGLPADTARPFAALGRQTFRGEIVDSKCWMGVMNPGVLMPHRACAVRCISGGIPPMLLVRREGAPPLNLLLVSLDGKPVNDRVLDYVAEPVAVTGDVIRESGGLITLRIDPSKIRRLGH
jgi:hypothetical protein